jgi:hypothetical protein
MPVARADCCVTPAASNATAQDDESGVGLASAEADDAEETVMRVGGPHAEQAHDH